MADNTIGNIGGDFHRNEAGRDIITAGEDIVNRDKIVNITEVHNHFPDEKNPKLDTAIHIPRLMPYLANRVDQELKLGTSIKAHPNFKQPLICVVHGEENECSDIFVERIVYDSLSKIIIEQVKQTVKIYYFSCDNFKNSLDLHNKMQVSLAKQVVGDMFADLTIIAQTLAQQNCPIVLCATLASDYCLEHKGIQTIEIFLEFWAKWSAIEQQKHLFLVCLCFDYKPVKSGFLGLLQPKDKLNTQIRDYLQSLNFAKFNLQGVVLPELNQIEQHQVEDWARIYLNHIHEKLRPKIKELFEQNKQHAIAMQPLAQKLEKMLQEFV